MKFLKKWSLLFIICFSSFLKAASGAQAAEALPQEEATVDSIWDKIQVINGLPEGKNRNQEVLKLIDLYTRFVDARDWKSVVFCIDDPLLRLSKEDLSEYLIEVKRMREEKVKREKEERDLHLATEREFIGAETLSTEE